MEDAYNKGGFDQVTIGFLVGAFFFLVDLGLVDLLGAERVHELVFGVGVLGRQVRLDAQGTSDPGESLLIGFRKRMAPVL